MRPEQPFHFHDPENVTKTLQRTYRILRGNVSYGSLVPKDDSRNIDGWPVTGVVTPAVADTAFSVTHGLRRVPVGFHVLSKNKAVDIYESGVAWTTTTISLKASVASATIKLFIF